jgi:hypothetical protein
VALLALAIGEPADSEEIGHVEEAYAILEREPFTRLKLVVDVGQPGRAKAYFH